MSDETTSPIPPTREAALKLALAEAQADENHELVLALLAEWRAGKPGALTSEFLVAVLAAFGGVYLAAHDRLELATIVWTVAGTVYTAARAMAKRSAPVAAPAPASPVVDLQSGPPAVTAPAQVTKAVGALLLAAVLLSSGCSQVSQQEYRALVEAAQGYSDTVGPIYLDSIERSDLPAQSKKNRRGVHTDFQTTLVSASARAGIAPVASAK